MTTSVLSLTDGTTTKNFSTGDDMKLIRFEPLSSLDGKNIKEIAEVHFTAAIATNRANIQIINRLFEQARNYASTQTGARVYIQFDPGSSGTLWRSRVFNGRVVLNDEVLGPWQYDTRLILKIEWERQPFWEGALTAIPLTNTSDTDNTTGIDISNCHDEGTTQAETATVVGTITGDGNASFTVTAAGMTGSPITESVAVLTGDTATVVATKAAVQLKTNSNITSKFGVVSNGADLIITRWYPAANDATMNIAYTNDTCTGLTPDATSANTVAGSTTAHENWVKINDEDVIGELPAPVKIEMYNDKNADDTDEIYIFHNVFSAPFTFDKVLEWGTLGGTGMMLPSSTCQSGTYYNLQWEALTETLLVTWSLSDVYKANGGRFGLLARWAEDFPYTNVWLRVKLEFANVVYWEGSLSIIPDTRQMHILDTVRIPPYLIGNGHQADYIQLKLYGLRNTAGVHTVPLDYLQLAPISGNGGWKRFKSIGHGVGWTEFFTYDETEGYAFRNFASDDATVGEFSEYGGPITLIPGEDQLLMFSTCDYNGDAHIDQAWTIKVWYRPRRNTL